jgi:ParB/RepB/Spo0J family partition protein
MRIAIDSVRPNPDNSRRLKAGKEADDLLRGSIEALGQLQAILVHRDPERDEGYIIVDGERRWTAIKAIGSPEIEATIVEDGAEVKGSVHTASAAANMARAAVSPLDQWRAIVTAQDQGYALEGAAAAVGVTVPLARRLDKLGRLHPDVLALIERFGLPPSDVLSVVALAPQDVQRRAAKAKGLVTGGKKNPEISWWTLRSACQVTRIPRSLALFDVDASGIVFEEDLFAEPHRGDPWSTTDLAGFMDHQTRAVEALIDAKHAAGERASLGSYEGRKDVVMWQTFSLTGENTRPVPVTKGARCAWYVVREDGRAVVSITEDKVKPKKAGKKGAADATEAPPAPRPAVTQKGMELVAQAKTEAIRQAVWSQLPDLNPADLLAMLVCALGANNVNVQGTPPGVEVPYRGYNGGGRVGDVIHGLLAVEYKHTDPGAWERVVKEAAATALERIVICSSPKSFGASGPAAEWIGQLVGATGTLPRFDTEEFLATVNGDTLRALCAQAGIKPGRGAEMRAALVGKLPDWRPDFVTFNADPPPKDDPYAPDYGAEDEDAEPQDETVEEDVA